MDAAGGIWEQAEPTPELLARLSPGGQQRPGRAQRATGASVSQLCSVPYGRAHGLPQGKGHSLGLGDTFV